MYKTIAIAGTFDRLHKGHKSFLLRSFNISDKVVIGLTSDRMAGEKFQITNDKFQINSKIQILNIQKYENRKKELGELIRKNRFFGRTEVVKIDDIYGPATEKGSRIEALVVTSKTIGGARKVNEKRRKLGMKSLWIVRVPIVLAEDRERICSTRIRLGEIDREGRVYKKHIFYNHPIPVGLRALLKKPLGSLLQSKHHDLKKLEYDLKSEIEKHNPAMIITIGDQVSRLCNEVGIRQSVSVVDFRVQRKMIYSSYQELGFPHDDAHHRVKNPPGHISATMVEAVDQAIKKFVYAGCRKLVRVIGEEDLAGVPAILLLPLSSIVIYGQPNEGVVVVRVTEEIKNKLFDYILKHR